jgi:hypothetical protein
VPELNPDGEPKTQQTPVQMQEDGMELRRAAREQDIDLMKELMQRMPTKQINSSAGLLAGMESSPDDKGIDMLAIYMYCVRAVYVLGVDTVLSYLPSSRTIAATALLLLLYAYAHSDPRCDPRCVIVVFRRG